MAPTIMLLRYRTSKPHDGMFSFELHGGAHILGFTEYWHTTKGWEVNLDVVCDTRVPVERRYFLIAAGGYNLTALGEYAAEYHVATYVWKAYAAYLFDITHLSETERNEIRTYPERLKRNRPGPADVSYRQRHAPGGARANGGSAIPVLPDAQIRDD